MKTVRRAYIFLVSAVSLQAVAWALLALLRKPLQGIGRLDLETIALQIAVIIIGLALYLGHWLWAERLARRETEERAAVLRALYLYGMLAGFLIPLLVNAHSLVDHLLRAALRAGEYLVRSTVSAELHEATLALPALAVLGLLWFYHWRTAAADARVVPLRDQAAAIRRLYALGFSGAGLLVAALAVADLLRWVLAGSVLGTEFWMYRSLSSALARLVVGLPLWLVAWCRAQQLFRLESDAGDEERASVARKVYLYLAIFLSVVATVAAAASVLASILRRALAPTARAGSGDWSEAASIVLVAGVIWAYHALALRRDDALFAERPRQALVRRIYHYLVAGAGLGALLGGLGGDVGFLIRAAGGSLDTAARGQIANFTAALLVGLAVWILPWRQVQAAAAAPGRAGEEESASIARKIYLYVFLFVGAMAVLVSTVLIVAWLVGLAIGAPISRNLTTDLAQAIAFSFIGGGMWLYHSLVLRADNRRAPAVGVQLRVAVFDAGDATLGRTLIDGLRRELPGLHLQPFGLTPAAVAALGTEPPSDLPLALAGCDVIVGPSTALISGAPEVAAAVAASPARKLLIPVAEPGWDWAGIERFDAHDVLRQTVHALKQIAAGQEVGPGRGLGAGAIAAIVIGVLIFLISLAQVVSRFLSSIVD